MTALLLLIGCGGPPGSDAPDEPIAVAPTAEDARTFAARADKRLRDAWVERDLADWAYVTDITDENEAKSAKANEKAMGVLTELVKEARLVEDAPDLDEATARQLMLLKVSTALPAPDDDEKRARLATIASKMAGIYAKGEYCLDGYCRDLEELTALLADNRDYDAQLDAWVGWRTISPPMRDLYTEFASLGNEGAKDIGFSDMGELWRGGYDMPADQVEKEADRLLVQVQPLYEQLHCYTRAKLVETYGAEKVPADGPIPAHLTGNMWAQDWANLYPMLEPYPGVSAPHVGDALKAQGYDPIKMVKTAEAFFTSIGLDPLPATFWERSMLTKPDDRE
ncbi:MAG: M2 family metallopeptidase, partial [Deltaproteobacteria bacterium]|nr:M2 family metallopeptidase [Deltaproteobacteria bacterium]